MWMLSACLLGPIVQSSLSDGFSSLVIAFVVVAAALATEIVLDYVRGSGDILKCAASVDGSIVVTALVLTLMMPNGIHPAIPAFGAVFAVLVVKHSFGGLGSNWLNPAAGAWLFLRFTWPSLFDAALAQSPFTKLAASVSKGVVDISGSPLAVLKIAGWKPSAVDQQATAWLNDTFFSSLGAELPAGYIDLFASPNAGLIADRGLFGLLCATVVLLATRLVRWYLPLVYLGVYIAAARVWGGIPFGGALFSGDMLFALFSGSVVLSAYVLSVDPSTGSKTRGVSAAAAAFAGLLSFWFRFNGGDAFGALLAVPVTNVFVVLLRSVERRFYYPSRGQA
jgi:electron transport complex protein RnfD